MRLRLGLPSGLTSRTEVKGQGGYRSDWPGVVEGQCELDWVSSLNGENGDGGLMLDSLSELGPSGGPPTRAVLLNKEAAPPDSFAPGFIPVNEGGSMVGL